MKSTHSHSSQINLLKKEMKNQLKNQDSNKQGSSNQSSKCLLSIFGFFLLAYLLFSIKNQPSLTEEDVFILLQRGDVIEMKLQPVSLFNKTRHIHGIKDLMEDQSDLYKSGNLTVKLGSNR